MLNNYDIGEILAYGVYFNHKKNLRNNLDIVFYSAYLRDIYDITMKNDLINVL